MNKKPSKMFSKDNLGVRRNSQDKVYNNSSMNQSNSNSFVNNGYCPQENLNKNRP